MAIRMTCPECEASLSLADDKRGKKVRCKECENVLTVPSANGKLKSAEVDEGESPTPDKKKKKKKKKSSDFPVVWIAVAAAVVVVLAIGGSVTAYFVTRPPAPPPQAKVDPPPPRDNRPAAVVKNPKSLLGQIRARGDQAARDAEMVGIVTLYHAYHDEVKNPTARNLDSFLMSIRTAPAKIVAAIRDKEYLINYKAGITSDDVVVYESEPYDRGYFCFRANNQSGYLTAQEMTAAGLEVAPAKQE